MAGVRRRIPMVFSVLVVAVLAASTVSLPAVAVATPPVTWGPPQLAVPTTTNIGNAEVASVSCSSAGNCAAGGSYGDGVSSFQAFVVSQTAGVWGTPQLVVPTTTNSGGGAEVTSVSCSSAGNCVAGGRYRDGAGQQAFVVSQIAGVWGAHHLVVPTTTNSGNSARVTSVSCSSAGNCTAGGRYRDGAGDQAFVVSQTAGVWGAHQLAFPTTSNTGNEATVSSVSCSSAGNCVAGGFFRNLAGQQAFVASQIAGVWEPPQLTVSTTTNSGAFAEVTSVSCRAAGNCTAGGYYSGSAGTRQAFVVSQTAGVWATPRLAVPAATNSGNSARVTSVSCSLTGNCVAGGFFSNGAGAQAFVVSQIAGVWETPELLVPTTTNSGAFASVTSVSCSSPGTCAAGGSYRDGAGQQAFVVSQTAGLWATHQLAVPTTTNSGNNANMRSVSCSPDGNCAAGGSFRDGAGGQAFVVNEDRATFADVGPTNPFYTFVQWMASSNISMGTAQPSGKPLYKPADAVSRQAMALFMFRLSGQTFTPPATSTFADVTSASHPQFYTAIEWMAAREISAGTAQPPGKPLFKPSDPVSRQAMAIFLARYSRANVTAPPTTQRFADVPLGASSAAAINWMFTTGVSTGTAQPSGLPLYKPTIPVSRQAMAAFLFRVDNLP